MGVMDHMFGKDRSLSAKMQRDIMRSQAIWGMMVWVHESVMNKSPLKPQHFLVVAALVDRDVLEAAGVSLQPMNTERLIKHMSDDLFDYETPDEWEWEESAARGRRTIQNEISTLSKELGLICRHPKTGWHATEKGKAMIHSMADDMARFAVTQANLLRRLAPETIEEVSEKEGFCDRAAALLGKLKLSIAAVTACGVVALALVGGTSSADAYALHRYEAGQGQAVYSVFEEEQYAAKKGPRRFGDDTLTAQA